MLFGRTKMVSLQAMITCLNLSICIHNVKPLKKAFILDVLQGYVPYKTAFKLGGDAVDNDKGLILKQRRKP